MASKKKPKASNKDAVGKKKVKLRTLKDREMLTTKEQALQVKGGFLQAHYTQE
jgi:hypothetical protein